MKEVIKENKGKITMGGMTAVAALVLLLLNIYEKTEAILERATPSSEMNISDAKFSDKSDYFQQPASKK